MIGLTYFTQPFCSEVLHPYCLFFLPHHRSLHEESKTGTECTMALASSVMPLCTGICGDQPCNAIRDAQPCHTATKPLVQGCKEWKHPNEIVLIPVVRSENPFKICFENCTRNQRISRVSVYTVRAELSFEMKIMPHHRSFAFRRHKLRSRQVISIALVGTVCGGLFLASQVQEDIDLRCGGKSCYEWVVQVLFRTHQIDQIVHLVGHCMKGIQKTLCLLSCVAFWRWLTVKCLDIILDA